MKKVIATICVALLLRAEAPLPPGKPAGVKEANDAGQLYIVTQLAVGTLLWWGIIGFGTSSTSTGSTK